MSCHDVRHLVLCAGCRKLHDRRYMAKIGKVYWHGRCVIADIGMEGLLNLPIEQLHKLTLGDIGVESMKAIVNGKYRVSTIIK